MAELLELADKAAGVGLGVGAALEPVAAELLVVDLVVKDVPDDHDHRVGDSKDGLAFALLAESSAEPPELGGQVGVFGAGRGPGRLAEGGAERGVAFAGLSGASFAG